MGTRNLTMVIMDGKTRVAQYGQWDGYPMGQGQTALKFLRKCSREKFRKCLAQTRWFSKKEIDALNRTNWEKTHPYLSRDTGAEILKMVYKAEDGIALVQSSFAADSLYCEWAYVIDLDKGTFEVYRGFNKRPLGKTQRFRDLPLCKYSVGKYYQVRMVKKYSLKKLPTVMKFLSDFKGKDD